MLQKGLTGNQLKMLALIAMTLDHIGSQILPQYIILRIIGRIAFPIFAYMIAEGCKYTRNRKKYLGLMAISAIVCQSVYYVAEGSLYQCVLVTFSLAIMLIYLVDYAREKKTVAGWCLFGAFLIGVCFLTMVLPEKLASTDFWIDYGIGGVILPFLIYLSDTKVKKIFSTVTGLTIIGMTLSGIQWYAFGVIPILMLYNGTRGKKGMKYLFYIYYPLHLVVIQAIAQIL